VITKNSHYAARKINRSRNKTQRVIWKRKWRVGGIKTMKIIYDCVRRDEKAQIRRKHFISGGKKEGVR
jgi:hypothetical protein